MKGQRGGMLGSPGDRRCLKCTKVVADCTPMYLVFKSERGALGPYHPWCAKVAMEQLPPRFRAITEVHEQGELPGMPAREETLPW